MTGPSDDFGLLSPGECWWRDHYHWLEQHGYKLRPRYHPEWKPPQFGSLTAVPRDYDDGLGTILDTLVDATCASDGERVMLRRIDRTEHHYEIKVARFLRSAPLSSDPRNHCCPILDVLQDPDDEDTQVFAMPFLHIYNEPPLETVGEAIEFFRQILECLHFMHDNHVVHRDIKMLNVVVDARPILKGFHPFAGMELPGYRGLAMARSRTVAPVKYYIINLGLSTGFSPDDPNPPEIHSLGGDRTVPDLQGDLDTARNSFPQDVYHAGNMIRKNFLNYYSNLGFMQPLIDSMVITDPAARPTMATVVSQFNELRSQLPWWKLRCRLVRRKDGAMVNLAKDVRQLCRTASYMARRIPAVPEYREK